MLITNFGVSPWGAVSVIPVDRDYPVLFLSGFVEDAIVRVCEAKRIAWRKAPIEIPSLRRELRLALDELVL